ncbi:YrzI family small protein [Terrilactibacillus sp. BCM23-1]|uniref:YrzI family small protein n=1 Tax=Terrilactibacillus tamarindi TaxID=2599694 RepID=A0A6N8CTS0_9BACI|nr:YrzI family small protein [Terrilactibacillus tamarindi]
MRREGISVFKIQLFAITLTITVNKQKTDLTKKYHHDQRVKQLKEEMLQKRLKQMPHI